MMKEPRIPTVLLQATLDSFDCPMWISDDSGEPKFLNVYAEELKTYLSHLDDTGTDEHKYKAVNLDGKSFYWFKKALNHGTNYMLNELRIVDEIANLKESMNHLNKVLNKYK